MYKPYIKGKYTKHTNKYLFDTIPVWLELLYQKPIEMNYFVLSMYVGVLYIVLKR